MSANKRVQVFKVGTDELVMEFNSVKECAAYFGVDSSYISYNLSGRYKTIKKRQYYCKAVEKIYHTDSPYTDQYKRAKAVDVFKDGELLATYNNVKLAGNATGVSPAAISQYCSGYRKKPVRGYTFKYNLEQTTKNKLTPVDLYDAETNELYKSFKDIKECAAFLGMTVSTIRANLRGESKTVKVRSFYCKSSKYGESI